MRLILHPGVSAEVEAAADFYDGKYPGLGDEFIHEVERGFAAILQAPPRNPLWPDIGIRTGVRRYLFRRFPFALAYKFELETVTVLALAHLRRRPGYWMARIAQLHERLRDWSTCQRS